ncbi:S8 family serine peptidase [Paracoccus sulfuroxidans]|uniref:Subtilase family protein n=1 Tax=Paracoccus sulfuroxidans TaxID=384678 RepID=A0A562NLV0_9RHOB|nr:S8 family serine peptidase [Paracoccus sulfuroxidans]TWI32961.1 subtilase family protein [Paracoccus sulfuroxidans]
MIALSTLDAFEPLLANLPMFAPLDSLPPPDGLGLILPSEMLSRDALPEDLDAVTIVAVIDHAIPFAHRLFTTPDGYSRCASIWIQDAAKDVTQTDIPFGREVRGTTIDQLRGLPDGPVNRDGDSVYRALGQMDPQWLGRAATLIQDRSHGAAVATIAAGYEPGDAAGLNHPLIAVSLPEWVVADTSGGYSPLFIQIAVVFIVARARELAQEMSRIAGAKVKPRMVVNLSYGITAGARDGSSLLEQMQDLIAEHAGADLGQVQFVLAVGNSREERLHAVLTPGQELAWQILPDDPTESQVEIWGPPEPTCPEALKLAVTLPNGQSVTTAFQPPNGPLGQIARLKDSRGRELARFMLQRRAVLDGFRQCLTVILPPTTGPEQGDRAPVGLWQLKLVKASGACSFDIQRDDKIPGFRGGGRQTIFRDPRYQARQPDGLWIDRDPQPADCLVRRNGTLNAYAGGTRQIRAGAAILNAVPGQGAPISHYCSLLDTGLGGDIVMAGDRGNAAYGLNLPGVRGSAMQTVTGTSITAPQVTRWLSGKLSAGDNLQSRAQIVAAAQASARPGSVPPLVDTDLPWRWNGQGE